MTEDILSYYSSHESTYTTGLFEKIPFESRRWISDSTKFKKSSNGVTYSKFSDAAKIRLTDNATLFDMFHGKCYLYMSYFITERPDWTPMVLKRDGWNPTIHVFAVKKHIDGSILFADARGITNNPIEFFDDFRFCKKNMSITKVTDLPELEFEQTPEYRKAYCMIYEKRIPHNACDIRIRV